MTVRLELSTAHEHLVMARTALEYVEALAQAENRYWDAAGEQILANIGQVKSALLQTNALDRALQIVEQEEER